MKYTVGYQYADYGEESFSDIVMDYSDTIDEVYFAWLNQKSARSPAAVASGLEADEAKDLLESDLKKIRKRGKRLNLLFNGNCYGAKCISFELKDSIISTVSHIQENIGLDGITTTSLFIANIVKENFPELEVRASVNMRIGTIQAMDYVRDIFDSFCFQREYNYDMERLNSASVWCKENGKKICLLANSGCLNFCSAQIFHDNLVSHLSEIEMEKNCMTFDPVLCRRHYQQHGNGASFLKNSSWIRPEDVKHYEGIVPLMKLATRTHENPRGVIHAYSEGRFTGNLFDLTEPGYGRFFKGYVLDNTLFPNDYWDIHAKKCTHNCKTCGCCDRVIIKSLIPCEPLENSGAFQV